MCITCALLTNLIQKDGYKILGEEIDVYVHAISLTDINTSDKNVVNIIKKISAEGTSLHRIKNIMQNSRNITVFIMNYSLLTVWWPCISKDTENKVKSYSACVNSTNNSS